MIPRNQEVAKAGYESQEVLHDLRTLYLERILPVEELCHFHKVGNLQLDGASFSSPPMVMLIGPYSAGKTSFIKHLVGKSFPGERVGIEPTTDKFVAIMNSEDEERIVPGNALTVTPNTPFAGLEKFGNGFLTRFEGSQVTGSEILKNLLIVDTPGILTGEKQTIGRSYNYQEVLEWFAERSDMIILMFDVQKIDVSDELSEAIKSLPKHYNKVRVILNKADSISQQNLVKVYGALLWNLGRVITTPEIVKVYIGSFWDQPLKNADTKNFMENEMSDLMSDLASLPRLGAVHKINDMVKRLRQIRVLVLIEDHLRKKMPMLGKDKKKKEIIRDLPVFFRDIMEKHELSPGDFPEIQTFKKFLQQTDISSFPRIAGKKMKKGGRLEDIELALKESMPDMLNRLPGVASAMAEPEWC